MGFCENIIKYFLFFTNFLIFLLSCLVLGLGIWVLVDKPSLISILDKTDATIPIYDSAAILFLVVASAAIFVSFFGCCGAYRESRCMLGTYFLLVLGLLILVTVGTVLGMSRGIDAVTTPLKDTLYLYDQRSNRLDVKEITQLWDQVQTDLHCCGVDSARDWELNPRYNGEGYIEDSGALLLGVKVPPSCCASAQNKAKCMTTPILTHGAYIAGCFGILKDEISGHINIVGGIAIAIIVVLAIDLVIALYMCTCGLTEDTDVLGRPKKRLYVRPGDDGRP